MNVLTVPPENRRIAAIGGLTSDETASRMFGKLFSMVAAEEPSVLFIPTASGDAAVYRGKFEKRVSGLKCRPDVLRLFHHTPDLELLLEQDVIVVGGGNTKSMLAVWKEWRLDDWLKQAWRKGTLLCGWSAGAICWFDEGVTDSWAGPLQPLPCLGWLPGSCCPHYSHEPERRPAYQAMLADARLQGGIAIDDDAAVVFHGETPSEIIAARREARAYHASFLPSGGEVAEVPLIATRHDV